MRQGAKLSKLEPKSLKMKVVGFLDAKKVVKFYNPAKQTVHESRNFTFRDEVQEAPVTAEVPGSRIEGESDGDV